MKLVDLLTSLSQALAAEKDTPSARSLDAPVTVSDGRLVSTTGGLHLYAFELPVEAPPETLLFLDVPVTVLPPEGVEATEGFVVDRRGQTVLIQTFEAIGQTLPSATLVPDTTAFLEVISKRLAEMALRPEFFSLGPAERLLPWLDPERPRDEASLRASVSLSALITAWNENPADRRAKLTSTAIEQVRANKRLLLITPDHRTADEVAGSLARALRAAGMPFKSLLSRYEIAVQPDAAGIALPELTFEAHMHQFYARSLADKAALRRKYERFKELTPLLVYKAEKQKDLDEVKLLEWRLLTQVSELQAKIKEIDKTLAEYEALPLLKRLAMQTVGKNVASLREYRTIYEGRIQTLMAEVEIARRRIAELAPEAAIPKELRPEYQELKEEIIRLGGTKKIRELLAAEEGTNRQAFLQNKRLVITSAGRVASDPLFTRVRFDVLLADEAPLIPAPFLLAAAGLVREKIILSGDPRDIPSPRTWASLWPRHLSPNEPQSAVSLTKQG